MTSERQDLTIRVDSSATDEHAAIALVVTSDMIDCNVHAWFDLFAKVLAAVGFDEQVIMQGACQLCFNECRQVDLMRRVADQYDLTLNELAQSPIKLPHELFTHLAPLGDT